MIESTIQRIDLAPYYYGENKGNDFYPFDIDYQGESRCLPRSASQLEYWEAHQPRFVEREIRPGTDLNFLTVFRIEDEMFAWDGKSVERGAFGTTPVQHPWTAKLTVVPQHELEGATS